MFISPAFAQGAGGAGGGSMFVQLLPIILIFVVFYFLLIRPQQRRMKEHRNMVQNLRRGDRVVTGGGIIGNVTKVVNDNEVQVEVAENVRVRVVKTSVQEVLSKTEPAEGESRPANQGGAQGLLGKLLGGGGQQGGQSSGGQSSGGQSGGGSQAANEQTGDDKTGDDKADDGQAAEEKADTADQQKKS